MKGSLSSVASLILFWAFKSQAFSSISPRQHYYFLHDSSSSLNNNIIRRKQPSCSKSLLSPTFQLPTTSSLYLGLVDGDPAQEEFGGAKNDPLVKDASKLLFRLSWLSWWAQLILTVISSVTLLFARNVITGVSSGMGAATSGVAILPNFLIAGSSIVLSYISIFWTWATRRLARRLVRKRTTKIQAANMLRKDIRVGVTLNLLGMALTILGAEQIIGALAIKVLTTSRTVALGESSNLLQPLDILVVQANTNTLFSHFCSITALLYLTKQVTKLDPPSTEGDVRD
jgi:hypothetical protein